MTKNEILTEAVDAIDLQRKIIDDLRKLNFSENVDEEAVKQWIHEDSKLRILRSFM